MMIVTEPNAFVSGVHDRMPVIIAEGDFEPWLHCGPGLELLKPAPHGRSVAALASVNARQQLEGTGRRFNIDRTSLHLD